MMAIWWRMAVLGGLGLLTMLMASSCASQGIVSEKVGQRPVMLNESLALTDAEIEVLIPQALRGSAEAASRLSDHYGFVRFDHAEDMYWAQIAAENGGTINEYNYGLMLKEDDDPKMRLRARFWLERAARAGDKEAAELLRRMPE
jgi:TPR repeat protein